MTKHAIPFRLRPMRWWDLESVLALERRLFPEDAWSPGMFWSELADTRHPAATRHYTVAEEVTAPADAPGGGPDAPGGGPDDAPGGGPDGAPGRVIGYAGLMAVGGTGDVQTIAVHRDAWGTGVGSALLTDLIIAAGRYGCERLLLEVRVDNDRAQRLYERFGFRPLGIRRGYYQPAGVDALVMGLESPGAAPLPTAEPLPAADPPADPPRPGEEGTTRAR
ncbi:ribosomal protein S18-alanine N-acetyltransferase [Allostreptomyces psammosilenae]|uniref:Ribosomal-protein-alanine N-acetyltransferase n=1 Tax=Allostreptomyces psammosilenae TaxID=1892865 RepID=A0A852ZU75_9ACTN|nr:ribosomal protein S18-alanine N-acetyltransferase [Allostreptomyces psammosilenae]NYI05953.1 ribosomal-protein-alanine N-acetyltransferase [Allostreptomyces psammosilenae]